MTQGYQCRCGGHGRLVTEPREVTIGHWSATVEDTFVRCPSCGEQWYLGGQMDDAQRKAAEIIRERHRLMSPERIRALRERMGFSQSDLENLLGVGSKTVTRWEKGSVVPGAAVSRLLEVIEAVPEVAIRLGWTHATAGSEVLPWSSVVGRPQWQIPSLSVTVTKSTRRTGVSVKDRPDIEQVLAA